MIGSLHTYLSLNQRMIMWVSHLNFLSLDTRMIFMPIMHALMASQCFLQFSKLAKSATEIFAQKKFLFQNLL